MNRFHIEITCAEEDYKEAVNRPFDERNPDKWQQDVNEAYNNLVSVCEAAAECGIYPHFADTFRIMEP